MNSTRFAYTGENDSGRWDPMGRCACLPILICLICVVVYNIAFSALHLEDEGYGLTPLARSDSIVITINSPDTHRIHSALSAGLPYYPAPPDLATHGMFAMPADTETTDSESTFTNLAKSDHFTSSCLAWTKWQSTACRCGFNPLYILYQSLLC